MEPWEAGHGWGEGCQIGAVVSNSETQSITQSSHGNPGERELKNQIPTQLLSCLQISGWHFPLARSIYKLEGKEYGNQSIIFPRATWRRIENRSRQGWRVGARVWNGKYINADFLVWDANNGGSCVYVRQGVYGNFLYLPLNFAMKVKLL